MVMKLKKSEARAPGAVDSVKKKYLTNKINELATNSNNNSIRDLYGKISEFKNRNQPRSNFVRFS
jgi:hypothetical protein